MQSGHSGAKPCLAKRSDRILPEIRSKCTAPELIFILIQHSHYATSILGITNLEIIVAVITHSISVSYYGDHSKNSSTRLARLKQEFIDAFSSASKGIWT
jgi:hypothetical protein